MFYKILQGLVMLNLPSELSPLTSITRGHDRRYRTTTNTGETNIWRFATKLQLAKF